MTERSSLMSIHDSNRGATFECIDCEQHYCIECAPGEDQCAECHTGPRCNDCAVEHGEEHEAEKCRKCSAATDDGEGWDGLCGSCADKAEELEEEQWRVARRRRSGC